MTDQAGLLPGTLDMLILKAVSLGKLHGYGVLLRIEQISGGALQIQQGALYPALYRLEHQGLIDSEWGTSDNNRRAKFYRLTAAGRRALGEETASWNRLADAIACALAVARAVGPRPRGGGDGRRVPPPPGAARRGARARRPDVRRGEAARAA